MKPDKARTLLDAIPEWRTSYEGDDAFSIDQISEAKKIGLGTARKFLHEGMTNGTIEQLWRFKGQWWQKVYRLRKP